MSMKNSNETIGNRTRDLPAFNAVPQPTVSCACGKRNMYFGKDLSSRYHGLKKTGRDSNGLLMRVESTTDKLFRSVLSVLHQ